MITCRGCGAVEWKQEFLDLGLVQYSGFFASANEYIPSISLSLIECKNCGLVQLKERPDPTWMYGPFYGYKSSQNREMIEHLRVAVDDICRLALLEKGSNCYWIDVGSNDGTLLSHVPSVTNRIGVDPNLKKFRQYYDELGVIGTEAFFGDKNCEHLLAEYESKIDVITSFSVFYDLDSPKSFVDQVDRLLSNGGIWVSEQSYMPLMVSQQAFDTICHEHLLYLTIQDFQNLITGTNLSIEAVTFNSANGGSFRLVIRKGNATPNISPSIAKLLREEKALKADWRKKIDASIRKVTEAVNETINKLVGTDGQIFALGASTKGNIFLEVTEIGRRISLIGEINQEKYQRFASRFQVPIVAEDELLVESSQYFLVLPWHFKNNFNENPKYKDQYLIYALPEIEIYRNGEKIE